MTTVSGNQRSSSPSRKLSLWAATTLAISAWGSDQATKIWVEATFVLGERIQVVPSVLYWQYHLNPGAAFSIGTQYTWIFTLISAAVLTLGVFQMRKLGGSWLWAIAGGIFLGGVAGNLTDRLFRPPSLVGEISSFGQGHVVDFISVPGFAIMNLSDIFIVTSLICICALSLWGPTLQRGDNKSRTSMDPSTGLTH